MRHETLPEDNALFRIKTKGHPIKHHFADTLGNASRIGIFRRQGMPVGDKKETIV